MQRMAILVGSVEFSSAAEEPNARRARLLRLADRPELQATKIAIGFEYFESSLSQTGTANYSNFSIIY